MSFNPIKNKLLTNYKVPLHPPQSWLKKDTQPEFFHSICNRKKMEKQPNTIEIFSGTQKMLKK